MTIAKLALPPGVVKAVTELAAEGRYVDSQWVRFFRGFPQKIGGWDKFLSTAAVTGIARGMLAWSDSDRRRLIAIGTHKKLYVYQAGSLTDITPLRTTATLGNDPFQTTNGSAVVTVTHTAHGAASGDYVTFSGASEVGGITVSGEYVITRVDADHYTITHSSAATSDATGGGASVQAAYQIGIGKEDSIATLGWGVGTWSAETWGTPRTNGVITPARTWSLGVRNGNLYANPRGGGIYKWDPSSGDRAAALTNAPAKATSILVTTEGIIAALGAEGALMDIAWCDQDDDTEWTPASTNTADTRTIQGGSELLQGIPMRLGMHLLLSDTSAIAMRYTGDDWVYQIQEVAAGCGAIGPMAGCQYGGIAYWMSRSDFMMFDGAARPIPNSADIRDYVYSRLNDQQRAKCFAAVNAKYAEIWFFYPGGGSTEIDSYAMVNLNDFSWAVGSLERTSWIDRGVFDWPLAMGTDGYIYRHEHGVDADGDPLEAYITTAPLDIGDGERGFDIIAVVPDFKDQSGELEITVYTRWEPQAPLETNGPFTASGSDYRVDTAATSGRQAAIKFSSNVEGGYFRIGVPKLDIQAVGRR